MAKSEVPMLDGAWLLGEEPRKPTHSIWLLSVTLLFVSGTIVWAWPATSRWVLQRHYLEIVESATTREQALVGIAGLNRLLPQSADKLMDCMGHPQPEVALLAQHAIQRFFLELESRAPEERRATIQYLAILVERAKGKVDGANQPELALLAAKIRDLCRADGHATSQAAANRLELAFDWTQGPLVPRLAAVPIYRSSVEPGIVTSVPVRTTASLADAGEASGGLESASSEVRSPAVEDRLPQVESMSKVHVRSLRDDGSDLSGGLKGGVDKVAGLDASRAAVGDGLIEREAVRGVPARAASPNALSAIREPVRFMSLHDVHWEQGSSSGSPMSSSVVATEASGLAMQSLSSLSGRLDATLAIDVPREEPKPLPRGLEQASDDQVVRLLTSIQPHWVQAAIRELERRQWNAQQLEMAIELAQGSTRQRMEAMERLLNSPQFQPIPWLTWMAEEGDREVRRHAIVLLGSIADESAQRQLRLLKNREKDSDVRDQIHRVLLSAGNEGHHARR